MKKIMIVILMGMMIEAVTLGAAAPKPMQKKNTYALIVGGINKDPKERQAKDNAITNIRLGCRYLSSLIHAYEIDGGLAAYNGGERRAALWIKNNRQDESILWEETRGYIPAVLRLYKQFREENGIL